MVRYDYLPVSREEMHERGWYYYDFLLITGDAYVDHPSFGAAVIGRVLEAEGYRVAVLAQPDWHSAGAFAGHGEAPVCGTHRRGEPGFHGGTLYGGKEAPQRGFLFPPKKAGLRPDRATIVYANRVREGISGLPVVIGGLEASLRRFAHYDYWDDRVRRAILFDSQADLLVYGMGETATLRIARERARAFPFPGSRMYGARPISPTETLPAHSRRWSAPPMRRCAVISGAMLRRICSSMRKTTPSGARPFSSAAAARRWWSTRRKCR